MTTPHLHNNFLPPFLLHFAFISPSFLIEIYPTIFSNYFLSNDLFFLKIGNGLIAGRLAIQFA